jgi:hypothetical protein
LWVKGYSRGFKVEFIQRSQNEISKTIGLIESVERDEIRERISKGPQHIPKTIMIIAIALAVFLSRCSLFELHLSWLLATDGRTKCVS